MSYSHVSELKSWFQKPIDGNGFISYYKDPEAWLKLVEQQPHREAFVAIVNNDRVVGFVDIEFDEEGNASFAFGVNPKLRGKGFGRGLLNKVISYAQARGAKTILGGVDKNNTACRTLLESAGFLVTADSDDVVEYKKQLKSS